MSGLPILPSDPPAASSRPPHVKGPVEVALEALYRLKAPQFYTLQNVRTVLRVRRRFSLKMVSLDKLKVRIPAGKLPDCENCVDLCCTGSDAVVSLRLRDLAALIDVGRTDLISFERPKTPPKPRWARKEADGSVFHRAFPNLLRDATGTCAALTEDRLCGLFPSWPLSCARYPYALDLQLGVIFYAQGCRSTHDVAPVDAPVHVRRLVTAVVDAYNARVRDIILLATAKPELEALGLLQHVRVDELGI